MSQFEFISVAQSLICSLIAARVLSFFALAGSAGRSYSVHTAWVAFCLVSVTLNWWLFWSYADVSWSYPLFVLSLSPIGFVYMMVATIVPSELTAVVSWRDYFYINKNRFFVYGAGYTLALGACIYLLLDTPLLRSRILPLLILLAISGAGLASNRHRIHVLVAIAWVLLVSAGIIGLFPLDLRVPSE